MRFVVDGEAFDTTEMLNLDVDGIYMQVYLWPARSLVFLQTFDETRGVLVRKAAAPLATALLQRQIETSSSDISSYLDLVDPLITPKRRALLRPINRAAASTPSGPNAPDASPARGVARDAPDVGKPCGTDAAGGTARP